MIDTLFRCALVWERAVRPVWVAFLACVIATPGKAKETNDEPLRRQIDQLTSFGLPQSPRAADHEFVRRIYLDLVGRTPDLNETQAFLKDTGEDKRQQLVDRLLASDDFVRHMTRVLDVMWMERRADKHIKKAEWLSYLRSSLAANKRLNIMAREILSADGTVGALRPAAKFYLERELEPNLLTRDVGRMFFGKDLQCAQCHDHPLISDYLQSDYYGLFATLNRSFLFNDPKAKLAMVAEKGEGKVDFKSVFTDEASSTGPRLPAGLELDEPSFAPVTSTSSSQPRTSNRFPDSVDVLPWPRQRQTAATRHSTAISPIDCGRS